MRYAVFGNDLDDLDNRLGLNYGGHVALLAYNIRMAEGKLYDKLAVVRARKGKVLHAIWYMPESEAQVNVTLCKRSASALILEPNEDARATCKRCLKALDKL